MRMGNCRFSPSEVSSFEAAIAESSFRGKSLRQHREFISQPVGPPSEMFQLDMMRFLGPQERAHLEVAEWVSFVARHREFFSGCALRLQEEGGPFQYFRFLTAVLAPRIQVSLLALVAEEDMDWFEVALELHAGAGLVHWRHSFRFSPGDTVWTHMSPQLQVDFELSALPDVCYLDGHRLVSDSEWLAWDDIIAKFPAQARRSRAAHAKQAQRPPNADGQLVVEHPWIVDVFAKLHSAPPRAQGGRADRKQLASGSIGEDKPQRGAEEVVPDTQEEDVFQVVQGRRLLWAAEHGEGVEHFGSSLRGGQWTAAHVGDAVDSLRCSATTARAKRVCHLHDMPLSATFSLKMYGDEVASLLGEVWIARMVFIMGIVELGGRPEEHLPKGALDMFEVPEAAVDLRARGMRAVNRRLDLILGLKPGYMR